MMTLTSSINVYDHKKIYNFCHNNRCRKPIDICVYSQTKYMQQTTVTELVHLQDRSSLIKSITVTLTILK